MILTVDVGNTETVVGLFRGSEALSTWRVSTDRRRTADEHALLLHGLLDRALVPSDRPLRQAVIASVVPALDRSWRGAFRALHLEGRFLDGESDLPIRLEVQVPGEVGPDRIANTLAAAELFGRDTVVVDLGTATTFDCIAAEGVFLGGVIAPGPRSGIQGLSGVASHLPQVEIAEPARVIGKNTRECLASGVFYTIVDAIDGTVERILEEWSPETPLVVATGGLAELIGPRCRTVDRVEPALTLSGLALAHPHLFPEATPDG